jgi:hypothetical protein
MATRVQHKRKTSASGAPVAADILEGEIVLNMIDKTAHSKTVAGTVFQIGGTRVIETRAVTSGNAIANLSKAPLDPTKVIIVLSNGSTWYSTNLDASGAFTLSGATFQVMAWSVVQSGIDLFNNGFTVVTAIYDA